MSAHSAERRLVKSSPELWAEVSDQESLGRRLHAFGEIRITGTEPESTVAWEGIAASGTVAIESAGWGTKVTVKVELEDRPATAAAAPAAEAIGAAKPIAPPTINEAAEEPTAEPTPESKPEPAREPAPEPTPKPAAKRGFFARLLNLGPAVPDPPRPRATSDEPAPDPDTGPTAEPAGEPEPMPDPIVVPEVEPEISTEAPEPAPLSADSIDQILSDLLDDLGAAHHRPFSRS